MARLSQLSRSIRDRAVLVTGAASGMGRATARLFADEGARVAVCDLDADGAERVAAEIGAAGGRAHAFALDVTDASACRRVVDRTIEAFGGLNILVNNAGTVAQGAIDDPDFDASWERVLDVNLRSHTYLIRAALEALRAGGDGRIVNVASTEALGGTARNSPYTASKHGVAGLTKALAVELGSQGITVNCVCPGPIRTGMTQWIPEQDKQTFARRRVPLKRYGEPEEVAHMILNLALPASSFVNGSVILVDGGLHIKFGA
ncbi:MAG: SDR family oxidoreductase [Proteobacteria bacterium]|nr:SDR family oxidoreductase [Pseudomonadota bacterium]